MPVLNGIHDFLWGLLVDWIVLVALFLTLGLEFLPWRLIPYGIRQVWSSLRHPEGEGEITAFAALMTDLGGMIGVGNLAGVALMVGIGGPGSLLWAWGVSLVGMAIKFADTFLAVRYRQPLAAGVLLGGPMLVMRQGLGPAWQGPAVLFALSASVSLVFQGNGVQVHQMAQALQLGFGIPVAFTGVVAALLAWLVISGGLRRISRVSCWLVPAMVVAYLVAVGWLLWPHLATIPAALRLIVADAFSGKAMAAGVVAVTVAAAVRNAVFATETGIGTGSIIHAAARPADPRLQGAIAMLSNLVVSVVCSASGLLLVCSGAYHRAAEDSPIELMLRAFAWAQPGSAWITVVALSLFAFTTVITFAAYGERCLAFVCGTGCFQPYRLLWVASLAVFPLLRFRTIWTATELMQALMVLPNLLALLLLSSRLFEAVLNRPRRQDPPPGLELEPDA